MDLPLAAPPAAYRDLLSNMRDDPGVAGAVVTGHKINLFAAGRDLFAELDPLAIDCAEVNAIRRTPAGLHGWARDPVSVGRVVDRIWTEQDTDVVCLGAGGTAVALAHHLSRTGRRTRLVCADPDPTAIEHITRLAPDLVIGHTGTGPWDGLVRAAPPGSLIVNATGMGKDRPGSPLTNEAPFPDHGVVWELNYRGALPFLHQALAQRESAHLAVHDGWELFCHGWAAALTVVLDLADDVALGRRFAAATEALRPRWGSEIA